MNRKVGSVYFNTTRMWRHCLILYFGFIVEQFKPTKWNVLDIGWVRKRARSSTLKNMWICLGNVYWLQYCTTLSQCKQCCLEA